MARTFAFGDIHGYLVPLKTLLQQLDPQPNDTLIFLGDVIDRGEDSKGVIDTIIQLREHCNVITIMGNHEEFVLNSFTHSQSLHSWLYYGGEQMLASFNLSPDKQGLLALPKRYLQFIQSMQDYHETKDYIFTHATPYAHMPIADQVSQGLRWERLDITKPYQHISGKTVVCGHTALPDGEPWMTDGLIAIDTNICGNQWLTALDIDTLIAHQANRLGAYRNSQLTTSV